MPTVDGSRSLLAAGANYNAGDWANVGAEASLEMLAAANLNRGFDLGLGVEALARIDGTLRQFLAADVNGEAHAAARVRAQVQMPLDLFDEAGIAIRLQAIAEAAVGVQLSIGLSIGDFLAVAGNDPRLRGAPLQLLKVFLDEFTIEGGVMAKAAASAMAYANLVATGSFIKSGTRMPGFTIAAEAGVGLKAGAGFRVFARFGVDDPRRLIRRTIDIAVDETLTAIRTALPAEAQSLVAEAAVPIKIGLRSAFELGAALAENGGNFSAGDQGKFALRLAQVGLEEMQRYVLERALEFASQQLRAALRELDYDNATWTAAQAERQALSARLQALPDEPFEATDANRTYWADVVTDSANLAAALLGNNNLPIEIGEPLAIVWCGAQLLMKSVERISVAQARVTAIGAPTVGTTKAFDGDLPNAPAPVRNRINTTLGRATGTAIRQADAVAYLMKVIGSRFAEISPEAADIMGMLTGATGTSTAETLSFVLSNLGAFVPGPDGRITAEASLAVLRDGLRTFVNEQLDAKLLPAISAATADNPEVRIYLDEVLVSTLRTVVDTVFETVLAWQNGNGDGQRALRELCSSLLMRLFGRSLVVTGDVMLTHALKLIQQELRQVAADANRAGGIVPTLSGLTGLDRELVADLVNETLEVCAETFGPMPEDRRARMRDLMYQMIDTTPASADASTLESLKAAGMVGNAEAALELAQLLGEEIAGNIIRFIQALLTRIAAALLALLQDVISDIQQAVEEWMEDIEALARELMAQLADLLREIGQLQQALDDAVDQLLAAASQLLGGIAGHNASRNSLRGKIKDAVADRALDALADFPGYSLLPGDVRRGIRSTVRSIVNNALDSDIFDPVIDVLLAVSTEAADLMDDLREIEPGDDLIVAIADIALDHLEDGLRDAFDGNPSLRIKFDAPIIGEINLGRIDVPIGTFVSVVRGGIRALGRFDNALAATAGALTSLLDTESSLQAAETEHEAASAAKAEADERINETRDAGLDVVIVQPVAGSAISGHVSLQLRISGGSNALLSGSGLSHRRLYVWINGQELSLANAVISEQQPPQNVVLNQIPGKSVLNPASNAKSHPLARTRAQKLDGLHGEQLRMQVPSHKGSSTQRTVTVGTVHRFAGNTVIPNSTHIVFPPRLPSVNTTHDGGASNNSIVIVTVAVPDNLVHEGINAIACVLVPGPAARRIKKSISFLYTAVAPATSRKPTMPTRNLPTNIPVELSDVLRSHGFELPTAKTQRSTKPRKVRNNTWVEPRKVYQERVKESRVNIQTELVQTKTKRKEIRDVISSGALRPQRPEKLAADNKKGAL